MSEFRVDQTALRRMIGEVFSLGHFFASHDLDLELMHLEKEEISWELFQGNLVDPAHTRQLRTFEAWNLYQSQDNVRSAEPLLAIKLDIPAAKIYVVRGIYSYGWEAYDEGNNVILTRETKKWVRELVGAIDLKQSWDLADLRDELICLVFTTVVGKSRLPLTSLEAPLPGFSLGQLGYVFRSALTVESETHGPLRTYHELIDRGLHPDLAWIEKAKLLETVLHAVPTAEMTTACALFVKRWQIIGQSAKQIGALLRTLFNEVALSPYTDLVDKALSFLQTLVNDGHLASDDQADFLSYLLRQQGRHLTAYDLITFHHRGANYPDALLVDAVLKELLKLGEQEPHLFLGEVSDAPSVTIRKRHRRRGLRQGWLIRARYEGLAVPDAPTSEGENTRILPAPYERVPEEQILQSRRRTKRLYQNDPLGSHLGEKGRLILQESMADLQVAGELQELGTALFLDRPLGFGKQPAEPDQTPLLSYEAFSSSLAEQRLTYLTDNLGLLSRVVKNDCMNHLGALKVKGLPITKLMPPASPGVVSLQDACKVAADFIVTRTTRSSLRAFCDAINWESAQAALGQEALSAAEISLIVRGLGENPDALTILDDHYRPCLRIEVDVSRSYTSRAGVDLPVSGVKCVRL
ncbi:MAG TPA: hypothetical protein VGZ25_03315 [Gemmataceae bacterium]|nr:hypothetical protein [Gemmataceae bacterium]